MKKHEPAFQMWDMKLTYEERELIFKQRQITCAAGNHNKRQDTTPNGRWFWHCENCRWVELCPKEYNGGQEELLDG